jgi:hypothetical protein
MAGIAGELHDGNNMMAKLVLPKLGLFTEQRGGTSPVQILLIKSQK